MKRMGLLFLSAPAEPVQQVGNVVPAIANPEALPEQIGDALRGPHRRCKAVRFGAMRQHARELRQLHGGQLRRTPWTGPAAQSVCALPAIFLGPLMDRLAAHPKSPGNRGQRFAARNARQGREAACFELFCDSSLGLSISSCNQRQCQKCLDGPSRFLQAASSAPRS
jgi:hypothetical protein